MKVVVVIAVKHIKSNSNVNKKEIIKSEAESKEVKKM
jgi:hypothetical protein